MGILFVLATILVLILLVILKSNKDDSERFRTGNIELLKEVNALRKRNKHLEWSCEAEILWEVEMMKVIGHDGVSGVCDAISAYKKLVSLLSKDIESIPSKLSAESRSITLSIIHGHVKEFHRYNDKRIKESAGPSYIKES